MKKHGITSKILEKDTNSDSVFGQVGNWGSGPGTHYFTTAESSTYNGRIDLKLMVNGVEKTRQSVTVSSSCGASAPAVDSSEEQSSTVSKSNLANVLIGYDSVMKLFQALR